MLSVYKDEMHIKMSVNTADKVPNSDIAEIISSLHSEDFRVDFKGYTHSKQGFVLQIQYIDHISDTTQWQNLSNKYSCKPDIDMTNQCVNLYFEKKATKSSILPQLIYLSVLSYSIYYLWTKYQPLQNYTSQT